MANTKVLKVLNDLEQEKLKIEKEINDKKAELIELNEAIQELIRIFKVTPGKSATAPSVDDLSSSKPIALLVEDILREKGKALNLNDILSEISKIRGEPTTRGSLHACLSRYRKKQGSECQIQSLGDGKYIFRETIQDIFV